MSDDVDARSVELTMEEWLTVRSALCATKRHPANKLHRDSMEIKDKLGEQLNDDQTNI